MRADVALFAVTVAVCGCDKTVAPKPFDPTASAISGSYRLASCSGAPSAPLAPPCGVYSSLSIGAWTRYDSVRVDMRADGTADWTVWLTSATKKCSNPSDPACQPVDTIFGVGTHPWSFAVNSDSTVAITLPVGPIIGSYNWGAGFRFWPRITQANEATWTPETIRVDTYVPYNIAHTFVRIP